MSGTVPPTVDVIQSKQIEDLFAVVVALQAQVAAMQNDVGDIKQQLNDGPPKFGEWPITGVSAADYAAVTDAITTAVQNAGSP